MKFALVIIVTLGLIALSRSAPAEESPLMEGENADEAAMNEVEDPNCGPQGGSGGTGEEEAIAEGQQTQQQQQGGTRQGRQNGKRKGGKGKGKKQNQEE